MSVVAPLSATEITVGQVLGLLDHEFASLATAVASNQYTLWLGSGISRDRVDDLKRIVLKVLSTLQDRIDAADATCRFRRAFDQALALASLSAEERAHINYSVPFENWPIKAAVLDRLSNQYSKLLDVRVSGELDDYLLWDVIDVPATFAAGHEEPDCEHLCVSLLASEGLLGTIISANWDGLLEAAFEETLRSPDEVVRVCVIPDDLRSAPALSRLLKFHGCAVRAGLAPAIYRHRLIARYSQITNWRNNADYALMRTQMMALAAQTPTLMVGMSAQDVNIQQVFADGANLMRWDWPVNPPANVFAEDHLGPDQQNILRNVYGGSFGPNADEIERQALLRAFGKPLLTGLLLHVLAQKFCRFVENINAPSLSAHDRSEICSGILKLRNKLGELAEPDRLVFVRNLIRSQSALMSLFLEGGLPADLKYRPISSFPVQQVPNDAALTTSGVREMAAALGILGEGNEQGAWSILSVDQDESHAALIVRGERGLARIIFAASTNVALALVANQVIDEHDDEAIVIHSSAPIPRMVRSPAGAPGRTGQAGVRDVAMARLLAESPNLETMHARFREEAVL